MYRIPKEDGSSLSCCFPLVLESHTEMFLYSPWLPCILQRAVVFCPEWCIELGKTVDLRHKMCVEGVWFIYQLHPYKKRHYYIISTTNTVFIYSLYIQGIIFLILNFNVNIKEKKYCQVEVSRFLAQRPHINTETGSSFLCVDQSKYLHWVLTASQWTVPAHSDALGCWQKLLFSVFQHAFFCCLHFIQLKGLCVLFVCLFPLAIYFGLIGDISSLQLFCRCYDIHAIYVMTDLV